MNIFIGSTNPVKINATLHAAQTQWPNVHIEGFSVESGVSEQPFSDSETKTGAENRAKNALQTGLKNSKVDPTLALGVGLEGGVFQTENNEIWSTVWGCVVDHEDNIFFANGARFKIDEEIAELLRNGEELGPGLERLLGESDVRQKRGMIGVITDNFVNRTQEYQTVARLTLGLWFGRNWDKSAFKKA